MQCLNDVRECVGYDAMVVGACHKCEYVGWSSDDQDNINPKDYYNVQFCSYNELNELYVGGKLIAAFPILHGNVEKEFMAMWDAMIKGSRNVIHLIHGREESII